MARSQAIPQNETTPFYPRSPYAAAKLYAYWITVNYREAYGMHASNGILFNHEGPTRAETFVTRKITRAVAAIQLGLAGQALSRQSRRQARLGPCARLRRGDVAHPAAARGRRLCPGDRRNAFGARIRRARLRRGRRRDRLAAARASRSTASTRKTGKSLVEIDPRYFRPTEVDLLLGDPAKAAQKLGWKHKTSFAELVQEMVASDLVVMKERGRAMRERVMVMSVGSQFTREASDAFSSPGIAAWSARRWCAGSAREDVDILTVCAQPRSTCAMPAAVASLVLREQSPTSIILAAAQGRRHSRQRHLPAEFLYDNLVIETNVIHAAHSAGVERLVFLGSSCIYPKFAPQPISEDALLTGPLEPTNEWYAIAKIAGIKLCQAYRRQYGAPLHLGHAVQSLRTRTTISISTTSHVLPALIRKFHEAKESRGAKRL